MKPVSRDLVTTANLLDVVCLVPAKGFPTLPAARSSPSSLMPNYWKTYRARREYNMGSGTRRNRTPGVVNLEPSVVESRPVWYRLCQSRPGPVCPILVG